jgi:hypothetical protein
VARGSLWTRRGSTTISTGFSFDRKGFSCVSVGVEDGEEFGVEKDMRANADSANACKRDLGGRGTMAGVVNTGASLRLEAVEGRVGPGLPRLCQGRTEGSTE